MCPAPLVDHMRLPLFFSVLVCAAASDHKSIRGRDHRVHVAVVRGGKLGRIDGKVTDAGKQATVDVTSLRMSAYCWKRAIDHAQHQVVKIFAHTWDALANDSIAHILQPTRLAVEKQLWLRVVNPNGHKPFEVFDGPEGADWSLPVLSMWYSYMRALQLLLDYEAEAAMSFDFVVLTRWDTCLCSSKPIDLRQYTMPPSTQIGVYWMGQFSSKTSKRMTIKDTKPFDHNYECGRGQAMNVAPRLADSDIVGTSHSLMRLASAMVYNTSSQYHLLGQQDPHGLLGAQVCRLFHPVEIRYNTAGTTVNNQTGGFNEWTLVSGIVRQGINSKCLRAIQSGQLEPCACYTACQTDSCPPAPPPHYPLPPARGLSSYLYSLLHRPPRSS